MGYLQQIGHQIVSRFRADGDSSVNNKMSEGSSPFSTLRERRTTAIAEGTSAQLILQDSQIHTPATDTGFAETLIMSPSEHRDQRVNANICSTWKFSNEVEENLHDRLVLIKRWREPATAPPIIVWDEDRSCLVALFLI